MTKKTIKVEMINPRGRRVFVDEHKVDKMTQRGFQLRSPGQDHEYNPIFDTIEGTIASAPGLNEVSTEEREYLDVEKI